MVAAPRPSQPRGRLLVGMEDLTQAADIGDFLDLYVNKPGRFCGREDDVAEVRAWLADAAATPNLVVTAPAGRGKSALLVRLAMELAAFDDMEVAFIPLSLRFETHRPAVFLRCLVARLHAMHGQPPPALETTSDEALRAMIRAKLASPLPDGRTAVILLDGLDEAFEWRIRPGLLPATHPAANRVIVSARERAGDPSGARWLREIGWSCPENAKIISLPLLDETDVEAVIAGLPPPHDAWARTSQVTDTLTRLCQGEPLTLWILLKALVRLEDPAALASWEPGLAEAFQILWDEQVTQRGDSARVLDRSVSTLLHLLAVAEGGLTAADLQALAPEELANGLVIDEALRSLTDLVIGDGKSRAYVLAHPGFAEHLREKPDLQRWRTRLVDYGRRAVADLMAKRLSPQKVPRYVVLHRAAQLQAEGAPVASWMELTTRLWYDAWRAQEQGASGFLHDVEQARNAVAEARGDGAEHVVEAARCALARGSVGSQVATVDAPLLERLLVNEVWTPEQAFEYVRAAPVGHLASEGRIQLVAALTPHAPTKMLPELFNLACDLWDRPLGSSSEPMDALMRRMATEALPDARVRLRKVATEGLLPYLLLALAKHVAPPQREEVLREVEEAADSVGSQGYRAQTLFRLAMLLEEPARERAMHVALAAARAIPEADVAWRRQVFMSLAAAVPEASAEALAIVVHTDDKHRDSWLADLIETLGPPWRAEAIERYRAEIEAATEPKVMAWRWRKLLDRAPEQRTVNLDAALDAISRVSDPEERAGALMTVLAHGDSKGPDPTITWRRAAAARAVEIVTTLADPRLRLGVLYQLHEILPVGERWRCAEGVWASIDEALRGPEAHTWSDRVRGPLRGAPAATALAQARQVTMPLLRAELLLDVARRLPPEEGEIVVEKAFEAVRAVVTPQRRVDLLLHLLFMVTQARQEEVSAALDDAIAAITDPYQYALVRIDLARRFQDDNEDLIEDAAAAVLERDLPHMRFQHLCELVELAGGDQRDTLFEDALTEAKSGAPRESWSDCLSTLTDLAPASRRRPLLQEGLARVQQIDDITARVSAALSYARFLPPDEVVELARGIAAIEPPSTRADIHLRLLEAAPPEVRERLFEGALAAARETEYEGPYIPTRSALLGRLIHLAPEAAREDSGPRGAGRGPGRARRRGAPAGHGALRGPARSRRLGISRGRSRRRSRGTGGAASLR